MKDLKKFHVLKSNFNTKKFDNYNILPTFRGEWDAEYNFNRESIKNKETLKKWILKVSSYYFRAKCEYEILLGQWPFGSYKLNERMKEFFKNNPDFNIDDYHQNINFTNVILTELHKIDIYEQIKMNIDIITDILYNEYKYKIFLQHILIIFKNCFSKKKSTTEW